MLLQRIVSHIARSARTTAKTPYGNPVPATVHHVVRQLKPGRVIVVGDVHGCHAELLQLMDACKYDKAVDNLFFAGDLVNKGPASVKVLREVPRLGGLAVRGNHDDAALAWYRQWRAKGAVPKARAEWVTGMSQEDGDLLVGLPFSIALPQYGVLIVHAGLVVGVGLDEQSLDDMYKMRNIAPVPHDQQAAGPADTQRHAGGSGGGGSEQAQVTGGSGLAGRHDVAAAGLAPGPQQPARFRSVEKDKDGQAWATLWPGPQHVFFGHDAKRKLQLERYATGLDSGCVYGGSLTAAVMPPLAQLLGGGTLPGSARGSDAAAAAVGSIISSAVVAGPRFASRFADRLAAGLPLSLEDLQGRLVSVPALEMYEVPGAKKAQHAAAAAAS